MTHFRTWLDGDGVTTGEVHWSAVGAGVLVALAGTLLLTLLSAVLGFAAYDPARGDSVSDPGFVWGAFALWASSCVFSAFAGGWAAGWVAGARPDVDRIEGGFQGFLTWAASTLAIAALVVSSSSAIASRLGGPLVIERPDHVVVSTTTGETLTLAEQQKAAEAASMAALVGFLTLLAGAIVGMAGGAAGVTQAKYIIRNSPAARTQSVPTAHAVTS